MDLYRFQFRLLSVITRYEARRVLSNADALRLQAYANTLWWQTAHMVSALNDNQVRPTWRCDKRKHCSLETDPEMFAEAGGADMFDLEESTLKCGACSGRGQ